MYHHISEFENKLAEFTGAPYVVATDCCTHAIEMCMRHDAVKKVKSFTCYTYLSVPMTLVKLGIKFKYDDDRWIGEYNFKGTRIWDSARLLHPKMYRRGQLQCLSFGNGKPLDNKRGGAILCGTAKEHDTLKQMGHDGRDFKYKKWIDQKRFNVGYHYNMAVEHAIQCNDLLEAYKKKDSYLPHIVEYSDCRSVKIKG
jgi:dTDP-4-amino-4,6-dideoxygalactose transaminase|tara:strand:+ start:1599 stop:2192 length:594 start_codon:yes stop_codon:yes gene_type:complete